MEPLVQRNTAPKSRDQNYYSTFCSGKKAGKSQQRAESDERKVSSSKLGSKPSKPAVNSSLHKNCNANLSKEDIKEATLKSIKKVLIKNINLQNRLNSTQAKKLQKSKESIVADKADAKQRAEVLAQKIPVTLSKSPISNLKAKPHKLVKDKNALSTKCVKAENTSEYFAVNTNTKELDNTPSLKYKVKRNEATIVKSTSDLKDISIEYAFI